MHQRSWRWILAGVLVGLLAWSGAPGVQAHAAGAHGARMLQKVHVAAGAYQLTIWTAPVRLRTGEIHVETIVYDGNGNLDDKCLVHVSLTPKDRSGPVLTALSYPMTGMASPGFGALREAAFNVPEPGRYQVEATVLDEAGTGGKVAFEIEVIRISPLVQGMIYLLLGASILAGVWMLRRGFDIWFGRSRPRAAASGRSVRSGYAQ